MGLFDKLFKKKKDVPEAKKGAPEVKNTAKVKKEKPSISEEEASELLRERFEGFAPIESERNREICDKFVARGIIDYNKGSFDETALGELTFDELCLIYNAIGQFVEKNAAHLTHVKESAALYKKSLRKKLLAMLSTFPVYTINATMINLPYIAFPLQVPSLLLYTNRKIAESEVADIHRVYDWVEIFEITPEKFDDVFGEYFCTGYKTVYINGKTQVKIEDVYKAKSLDEYGHTCIESCSRMVNFRQTSASIQSRAKAENRNLAGDEIELLNNMYYNASVSLWEGSLCLAAELPAEFESKMQQDPSVSVTSFFKDGHFPILMHSHKDGQHSMCLFTDLWAVQKFYKKAGYFATFPILTRSEYNEIKNDNTAAGFLINPGREGFFLSKDILNELSAKGEKPSISEEEASELLQERFEGFAPIESERNREICNKFVAKGIIDYKNGSFDEAALSELTFDELCLAYNEIGQLIEKTAPHLTHLKRIALSELTFDELCLVYDAIGQFVEKNASHLTHVKESAALYKKFLRRKILERLSTFPVYTINAKVTNTPCAFHPLESSSLPPDVKEGNLSLPLYTSKEAAELEISDLHAVYDWVEIFEITPEKFDTVFGEYFCTGYKTVCINGKTKVKIEDVYKVKSLDEYGHTCVKSCSKMIVFMQTSASIQSGAKAENRNLDENEMVLLNSMYYNASVSLWEDTLCLAAKLPAESEKLLQQDSPIPVPSITSLFKDGHFPSLIVTREDGQDCICVFTDSWAVQRVYKKEAHVVTISVPTKTRYDGIKNENTIVGILVNPEREGFFLSKNMLNQLSAKEEKPSISEDEASELLQERFQGFAPVSGDRNQVICDKFVAKGIIEYNKGSFDETALSELTFDEFCHVYSTIGWFVKNIAPNVKESAALYKKFLRKKLLAKLSTFPVYTVNAKATALPYVENDSSFLLYTNKKLAEAVVSDHVDWLEVSEIAPEHFNAAFCEFFCTGYKVVNVNGQTKVKIDDVYEIKPIRTYGNICVESCVRMIDYKQTLASLLSRARTEKRDLSESENKRLNQQSYAVSVSLLKNTLLLPAEQENGMPKEIIVPLVSFGDGRKFVGLFTDQGAINRYYRKSVPSVALPELIRDQYDEIKNDNTVSGIIINPGREEYMMTKDMLHQLLTSK